MAQYVNPLAAALVRDPADLPDLVFIIGYVGPSDVAKATRIYLDPAMSRLVDIPEEQVLHTEEGVSSPKSPVPVDVVWVTRRDGARLRPRPANPGTARQGRPDPVGAALATGTVLTINIGGGGAGQPSPADDGGIGSGGAVNWNQQWP